MGPHASEREGERVLGGTARLGGGGRTDRRRVRWCFSDGSPILGGWGGGLARVGVGGNDGGVNFTSGDLEEAHHGEVAGLSWR
jgi:hypothetical protein